MVSGVRGRADLRANGPGTDARATTTGADGQMEHAPTATPRLRGKTRPVAGLSRAGAAGQAVAAEPTAMAVRLDAGMRFAQFAG